MKDVLVALVPVIAAVIPAYLLYKQGMKSSERESLDRAAERKADERRRDQELEREELRLRELGQQTAAQQERARYTSFLQAVHQVRVGIENALNTGRPYVFPPAEQERLATTYEDLMLDANDDLADKLTWVRQLLSEAAEQTANEPPSAVGSLDTLDHAVEEVRARARTRLGAARADAG